MRRKRKNPMKIGKGEYKYHPEEIQLMGKIPDRDIAKIFSTTTALITKGKKEFRILGSPARSKKNVWGVLTSLDMPRSYFKALGLDPKIEPTPQQKPKLKYKRKRGRKPKQRATPGKVRKGQQPVSYTHLPLPTILLV